jgi:hypothetical protein
MAAEGEKTNRYNYPGLAYEGWPTPDQVSKLLADADRMRTIRDEARSVPFLRLVSLEREATAMFDYWNNVERQGLKFTTQYLFTLNYAYCKFQKYYAEQRDQLEAEEDEYGNYANECDERRTGELWRRMRDSSATVRRTSQSRRVRNGPPTADGRRDENVPDQRADGLQGV